MDKQAQLYHYKISYVVFFTDGSKTEGEITFESSMSQPEAIPLEQLLPYFEKLDGEYRTRPDFHGMSSQVVRVEKEVN